MAKNVYTSFFSGFNEHGGVGKDRHCLWCGRKLRKKWHMVYKDGFFCGLRCGHDFAELGKRLASEQGKAVGAGEGGRSMKSKSKSGQRQLISSEEAVEGKTQPRQPCSDCPFARTALRGWLGGATPEEYRRLAHADIIVDCHAIKHRQCAGLAIYRTNVAKRPPDGAIHLPADRAAVFATPTEFLGHHTLRGSSPKPGKRRSKRSTNKRPHNSKKKIVT